MNLYFQGVAPMGAVGVGKGLLGTEGLTTRGMFVVGIDGGAHIGGDPLRCVLFA